MPKSVLLDLDNTLIDRSTAHLRYCEQFADCFLSDWSPSDRKSAMEMMVEYDQMGYRPRDEYFQWLARQFGRGRSSPEELWHDYQNTMPNFVTRNHAVCRLVSRLAERYSIAIVSNGSSRNQRRKWLQSGLHRVCSAVVISGEVGFEKPHPAIFQAALDALKCKASDALFVGDDPEKDIGGAAKMGMETCWIRFGLREKTCPVSPTYQIETILELETILLQ